MLSVKSGQEDNKNGSNAANDQQQQSSSNNDTATTTAVATNDTNEIYLHGNRKREQFVHKSKSDAASIPRAASEQAAAVENADNISIASTADTYKTAQQCSSGSSIDDFFSCASTSITASSASSSPTSSTTELAAVHFESERIGENGRKDFPSPNPADDFVVAGDNSSPTTSAKKNSNNNQLRASLDTLHDLEENIMDEQQQLQQQEQEAVTLRRELAARSTTPVAEENSGRFRGWTIPATLNENKIQKNAVEEGHNHDDEKESHETTTNSDPKPLAVLDDDIWHADEGDATRQSPSPPTQSQDRTHAKLPVVRLPSSASSAASDDNINDYTEPLQIVDDDYDGDPLFIRESASSPLPPTLRPILKKSRYEDYVPVENYDDFVTDQISLTSLSASTTQSTPEPGEQQPKQSSEEQIVVEDESEKSSASSQKRITALSPTADATSVSSSGEQSSVSTENENRQREEDTANGTSSSSHQHNSPVTTANSTVDNDEPEIFSGQKESASYEQYRLSSSPPAEPQLQAEKVTQLPFSDDVDEIFITERELPSPDATTKAKTTEDAATLSIASNTAKIVVNDANDPRPLSDETFRTAESVEPSANDDDHVAAKPNNVSDETTYVLQLRKRPSIPLPLPSTSDDDGQLEGETVITKLEIAEDDDAAVDKNIEDKESEEEETEALTITEIRQRHAEEFAAVENAKTAAAIAADSAELVTDVTLNDDNLMLASISPPPTPTTESNISGKKNIIPLNLDDETGSHTTTDPEGLSVIDEESEPVNTEDERERNLLLSKQSSVADEDEPLSPITKTAGIVELPASDTNSDGEILQPKRANKFNLPTIQPLRRNIVSSTPQRRKMLNLDQFVAATEHRMSDYVSNSAFLDDFTNDEKVDDDTGPREFGEESLIIVSPLDLERASLKSGSLYNSSNSSARGGIGSDDNNSTLKKSAPKRSSGSVSDENNSSRDDGDSGSGTISTSSVEEEDIPVIHIPNQHQNNNLINLTDALSYGEDEDEDVSPNRFKPLHKLREPTETALDESQPIDIKSLILRFEQQSSGSSTDDAGITPVSEKIEKGSAVRDRFDFQQAAAKESVGRLTATKLPQKTTNVETPIALLKTSDALDDEPAWKRAYKKRFLTENTDEPSLVTKLSEITPKQPEPPAANAVEVERSSSPRSESRSGAQTPTDESIEKVKAPEVVKVINGQPENAEKDKEEQNVLPNEKQGSEVGGPFLTQKADEESLDDETSEAERNILQKLIDKYENAHKQETPATVLPVTASSSGAEGHVEDVVAQPIVMTVNENTDTDDEITIRDTDPKPQTSKIPPPIPPRPAIFRPVLLQQKPMPAKDDFTKKKENALPTESASSEVAMKAKQEHKILSSTAKFNLVAPTGPTEKVSPRIIGPTISSANASPTERPALVAHKQWQTPKPGISPKTFASSAISTVRPDEPVSASKLQVNLKDQRPKETLFQPPTPPFVEQRPPPSLTKEIRPIVNTLGEVPFAKPAAETFDPFVNQTSPYDFPPSRLTSSITLTPTSHDGTKPSRPGTASTKFDSRAWPPTYATERFDAPTTNGLSFPSAATNLNGLQQSGATLHSSAYKKTEYANSFMSSNSSLSSSEIRTVQKPQKPMLSWPPRLPEAQKQDSMSVSSSVTSSSKPVQERTIPVTVVGADGKNRRIYGRSKTSPLTTSSSLTVSSDEENRQKPTDALRPTRDHFNYSREHTIPISVEHDNNSKQARQKTSTIVIATRDTPTTTTYKHRDLPVFEKGASFPSPSLQSEMLAALEAEAQKLQQQISPSTYFQQLSQNNQQTSNSMTASASSSRRVWNQYGSTLASQNSHGQKPVENQITTSGERTVPISVQPRRSSFGGDGVQQHSAQWSDDSFDMHLAQQAPVTLAFAKRKTTQSQGTQRDSSLLGSSTTNFPNPLSKLPQNLASGRDDGLYRYVVKSDYVKGQLVQQTTSSETTNQRSVGNSAFVRHFQQGRHTKPNDRVIVTDFGHLSKNEFEALYEANKDCRLPLQSSNPWDDERHGNNGLESDELRHRRRRQNGGEVASEYREVINMLDECMKNMSQLLN